MKSESAVIGQGIGTTATVSDLSGPVAFLLPNRYLIEGNYPNPFNPTTRIRYGLPEEASVSLKVYDLLGQEVAQLLDAEQPAGEHEVIWDGRQGGREISSSGIYICRMVATSSSGRTHVATIRMMLVK